ncbi:ferric reductase-like transmembrane domain-containing protein [Micromonospora sp. NPDC006766]|uniref:ferric reductase-like transmembrane domain-containing protein n=1 Tax=Micromonospora sp. NPDC006766 TaxID=3154778 RepID=UPI0033D0FF77
MDGGRTTRSPLRTTGLAARPARRNGTRRLALGAAVAVVTAAAFTPVGRVAIARSFAFLEFFTGVFSLVGLSITVMIGLAATDRLLLLIRHRILLQIVHRATAATAMVCLAIHVATKLIEGHAQLWDPAVPFLASHRPIQVGLGTLASYLMIVATWTGVTRASYAQSRRPGRWRVLHATAYAAWGLALVHGLTSGRPAPTWVVVSYSICIGLVTLALLVRLFVALSRRTHLAAAQTTRRMRPTRQPEPAAATPLATNVLIPTLGATEWADVEPDEKTAHRPAHAAATPAAERTVAAPAAERTVAAPRQRRASDYRPYRPLREERPVSPPHSPAPAGEPVLARQLDETVEITDEEFWAYIRNEVGR